MNSKEPSRWTIEGFEPRLKKTKAGCTIFDPCRVKYVHLSPEEWVRQNMIFALTQHYNYPLRLIKVESGLRLYRKRIRSDLHVYDPSGRVQLLMECKSLSQRIDDSAVRQLCLYNNVLKADTIVLTNGLNTFIWVRKLPAGDFVAADRIPPYAFESKPR